MAQNADKTKAQWGFPILLGFILAAFIIAFGVQTWLFVDSFMPHNQLYLKIMTVVSFDGMALVYFLLRMFYKHWNQDSRHAIDVMFIVCMVGSLACTVLWTFLQAINFQWSSVPPLVLWIAYAVVTVAIPVNALVIYYIVDKEISAYRKARGVAPTPIPQQPRVGPGHPQHGWSKPDFTLSETPVQAQPALPNPSQYLSLLDKAVHSGQITEEEAAPLRNMIRGNASPLAEAPASQNGASGQATFNQVQGG